MLFGHRKGVCRECRRVAAIGIRLFRAGFRFLFVLLLLSIASTKRVLSFPCFQRSCMPSSLRCFSSLCCLSEVVICNTPHSRSSCPLYAFFVVSVWLWQPQIWWQVDRVDRLAAPPVEARKSGFSGSPTQLRDPTGIFLSHRGIRDIKRGVAFTDRNVAPGGVLADPIRLIAVDAVEAVSVLMPVLYTDRV